MQYVSNLFGGYSPLKTVDSPQNDLMSASSSDQIDTTSISIDSQSLYNSTTPPPGIKTKPSINTSSNQSLPSTMSQNGTESTWFNSLWAAPPQDEMSTTYDVESQTTVQTAEVQHEQSMSTMQRWAVGMASFVSKKLPVLPELTYTQKLITFLMFSIAGVLLLLNALMNLPSIFFGGASKFALSFTTANLFFIFASLFITNLHSHFLPHRRFTTILYLCTLFLTLFTAIYLPYAIIVLPVLLLQLGATVFHVLSFFTSAVNVELNLGQAIITNMFRQAL